MFLQKGAEGEITGITKIAKAISAVVALVIAIGGAAFFMQDRMSAIAKDTEIEIVKTFKMYQRNLRTEQKGLERKWDVQQLRDLRDHKLLLRKELKRDPINELIQESLERIQAKINQLEAKLYQ